MDPLFAPWRMEYILSGAETPSECIFCSFPARGRAHYREHLILAVQRDAFVMMNKFPYNNGHLLVIPRRHVSSPNGLDAGEWSATGELLRAATGAVGRALKTDSFNIGMNLGRTAGAGIDAHLHWHIVPRWNGDTNFMPVLAETKVISDHLIASYERLLPEFAALGEGPSE